MFVSVNVASGSSIHQYLSAGSFRSADRHGQMTLEGHKRYYRFVRSPQNIPSSSKSIRSLAMNFIVTVPFFGIPRTYFAHVKHAGEFRVRLSGVQQNWYAYNQQLTREYSDFILVVSALTRLDMIAILTFWSLVNCTAFVSDDPLSSTKQNFDFPARSATIGLLAIPGIEQGARTTAIISVFASLGSITVGVFLIWRHQRNSEVASTNTTTVRIFVGLLILYPHSAIIFSSPISTMRRTILSA